MPFADSAGVRLFYRVEGSVDRPPLVLAHSLGTDHAIWQGLLPDLLDHFRVVRYDIRGHGASDAPPGDYRLDQLARDALAVADAAGVARFAFCGLSLGGMIGQALAVLAPERLTHLVLANTSPYFPDPALWEARRKTVIEGGMAAIIDGALDRSFSARFRADQQPAVASFREIFLATDPVGYAGCCAAIRDMDQRETLASITAPTLVASGDLDVSTPWEGHSSVLADQIPGAEVVKLAAAHLSPLERPRDFLSALFDFVLSPSSDPLASGFAVRRAMLGDEHVQRSTAGATPLNAPFQELITRYAWGSVWTRPGLDRRTRRLLVLASTASLGRWEEFRLHVRTGLARELEASDLREVLMQVAVYAGVPAANTGFHIAAEEIASARDVAGRGAAERES